MKKTSTTRKILGPPNAEAHRQIVRAAKCLARANVAYARDDIKHIDLSGMSIKTQGDFEGRFKDKLWAAANLHGRGIKSLEREFRSRWFIWRSVTDISLVTGYRCEEILSGVPIGRRPDGSSARAFFKERSLSIWIARTTGDISFLQIGAVLDRDHSSVMAAFRRADDAISRRDPKYFDLLTDILHLENNKLESQKGHFIRTNRS